MRELSDVRDIDEALQLMVDLAAEIIAGVDFADIMFIRDGEITVPVSTHLVAEQIDHAQQEAGEGPCLDVLRDEEERVVAHDLEHDGRWPNFTSKALELGIRSSTSRLTWAP